MVSSIAPHFIFWKQRCLLNCKFTMSARLGTQELVGATFLFSAPQRWFPGICSQLCLTAMTVLWIKAQNTANALPYWAIFLDPVVSPAQATMMIILVPARYFRGAFYLHCSAIKGWGSLTCSLYNKVLQIWDHSALSRFWYNAFINGKLSLQTMFYALPYPSPHRLNFSSVASSH